MGGPVENRKERCAGQHYGIGGRPDLLRHNPPRFQPVGAATAASRPLATDKELSDLTLAVTAINSWNRLSIAARTVPGTYQPAKTHGA